MGTPAVSIGFPVYNGTDFIDKSLGAILNQTFADFELIVSDNASTDGTSDFCRRHAERDPRIRYHRNEVNMGCAWNFNNVYRLATGRYFIWACHDDLWTVDLLKRYTEILEAIPDVVCCYSRTVFIDENGDEIRGVAGRPDLSVDDAHLRFRRHLQYHTPSNECSPVLGLFRTEALKGTPLINRYPSSDMILLGEIALCGKMHEIQDVLLYRRDHSKKSTTMFRDMEERAAWNDPAQKGRAQFTTWRWFWEWHRSILRSSAGLYDKLSSCRDVWRWASVHRINLKKELKYGIRRMLRMQPHKSVDPTRILQG